MAVEMTEDMPRPKSTEDRQLLAQVDASDVETSVAPVVVGAHAHFPWRWRVAALGFLELRDSFFTGEVDFAGCNGIVSKRKLTFTRLCSGR